MSRLPRIIDWNRSEVDLLLTIEDLFIDGYERVVKIENSSASLHALIAIHNTKLGPSLGGIRMHPYASFADAQADVLRLAKGMTFKAAVAGTGTGGGKGVIIGNPHTQKTEVMMRAFGEAVQKLQGHYICAEDVGISPKDIGFVAESTRYVVGLNDATSSGDPAPFTARGTLLGIKAALFHIFGTEELQGRSIAIQGLGAVGMRLAEMLYWEGALLTVADPVVSRVTHAVKQFGAKEVPITDIHKTRCDVFAPCALGGIVNDVTVNEFRCLAIAGSANNQLLHPYHGLSLKNCGILYAPDFVISAGGLINVSVELEKEGYSPKIAREKISPIYNHLLTVFDIAKNSAVSTDAAAMSLADYRLKYEIGKRTEEVHFHTHGVFA